MNQQFRTIPNARTRQLSGYSSLGSPPSVTVGAIAATAVIMLYIVPTVISVLVQNKFLGFNNRLTTKQMSGRAAALGALMGVPAAIIVGSSIASGKSF